MPDFVPYNWVMQSPIRNATEMFVELWHFNEISETGCTNSLACQEVAINLANKVHIFCCIGGNCSIG